MNFTLPKIPLDKQFTRYWARPRCSRGVVWVKDARVGIEEDQLRGQPRRDAAAGSPVKSGYRPAAGANAGSIEAVSCSISSTIKLDARVLDQHLDLAFADLGHSRAALDVSDFRTWLLCTQHPVEPHGQPKTT